MALQESTKGTIQNLRALLALLDAQVTDNLVTEGKANSTAILAAMGTLNTAIQAQTNFANLT